MILYRREPYPLQMKNIILMDEPTTKGCLYINKQTYDQAIIIASRMDNNPERVLTILVGPKFANYGSIPGFGKAIRYAMENMPSPINCLAPFLLYCIDNQGIDWENADMEMMYGILHQFSQLIDFNNMLLVPAEVRASVSLPTMLLLQYKEAWDDLCSSLKDKVVLTASKDKVDGSSSIKSTPKTDSSKVEESTEDEEDDDNIDWDALQAKLQAIKDAPPLGSKPTEIPVRVEPVPKVLVQVDNEAEKSMKILDEFDC